MPSEAQVRPVSHARSPSLRLLARISQYELLNRMWSDKTALGAVVRGRDFAYPDNHLLMIAGDIDTGSVSDTGSREFAELLSGPLVDLVVGQDRRRWSLHRNLLLRHAPRLVVGSMSDDVRKTQQQSIELLRDDPAGFQLFVKWLYQGRLDDVGGLSDEQKYEHAVACHKLYLLCDRFNMAELKNLSMDHYRISLHEAGLVPDPMEINEIYRASPRDSAFRKLMTQIAARQIMDPDDEKDAEDYRSCFADNPDFAVNMVNAIRKGTRGILFDDPTGTGESCAYHDHTQGAGCSLRPRQRSKSTSSYAPSHAQQPGITLSVKPDQSTVPKSPEKTEKLNEEDLIQLLKALPTTSIGVTDESHWHTVQHAGDTDQTPQAPPQTPARPPSHHVKTQQDRLQLASAVGSMDTILEADRRTEDARSRASAGGPTTMVVGKVPRGENPLNYVAALRLKQQGGGGQQTGLIPRKGRDLFEV